MANASGGVHVVGTETRAQYLRQRRLSAFDLINRRFHVSSTRVSTSDAAMGAPSPIGTFPAIRVDFSALNQTLVMHEKSPALPVCYCAGVGSALGSDAQLWGQF